jgi:hypothetical protein
MWGSACRVDLETGNWKIETGDAKIETGNSKLENRRPTIDNRKSTGCAAQSILLSCIFGFRASGWGGSGHGLGARRSGQLDHIDLTRARDPGTNEDYDAVLGAG